jgi:alkaline phosphatase
MKKTIFSFICGTLFIGLLHAQYTTSNAHSHNDYVNDIPFWPAYYNHFGSIEADIWAVNGELYVAHDEKDITPERTLDALYLLPIIKQFKQNGGKAWKDINSGFQLLVDLKSETVTTLNLLCKKLAQYPEIFDEKVNKNAVRITITGKCPSPSTFENYPLNIYFDGKIGFSYSPAQLKRLGFFSEDLKRYTPWNGKANIPKVELTRLTHVIDSIHQLGLKIRFWDAPDNINSWKTFIRLHVDYINTDHIYELASYLKKRSKSEYINSTPQQVYQPLYKNDDRNTKVKNIILLIGDGMGLAQLYAGYSANHGALSVFTMHNIGFSKTSSADSYNTDSGAGGTAMATGTKTNNRYIGVDTSNHPLKNIPEIVSGFGMKSGIISCGDITDATPAVFYAHQQERSWSEKIAADFLSSPADLLMGGNVKAFNGRSDGRNILEDLKHKDFQIGMDYTRLNELKPGKMIVLDDRATKPISEGRGNFLLQTTHKALEVLGTNKKGFFLMVEGAQIDHGGHHNDLPYVVREMHDFDKVVGEALRFADQNGETLVIVTADHETGGLSLLDGNLKEGMIDGQFSTDDHTGVMVPVFAYGPHSPDFRGVYENTEIFHKIIHLIKLYHH